jgi:ribosomal-protein-alanine N-acetyltransferase
MQRAGGREMKIEFKRLSEVDKIDMINLANDPLVRRHMPLSSGTFDEADYERFVADKERLWEEHGYGPWAFFVDGKFAGWGSLQPEDGDADVALVLNPDYWGTGRAIYEEIVTRAFGELGFDSVTALLPPSRTNVRGMMRLGFEPDGEAEIGGERFIRYRLRAPRYRAAH